MMPPSKLRLLLRVIGWLTALTGALQLVMPSLVLGPLKADITPASSHFFSIVGMFMILFGGQLAQATMLSDQVARAPLAWCGLQKLGASAAVGVGVLRAVFSPLALVVACFDLVSGVLIFFYRGKLRG